MRIKNFIKGLIIHVNIHQAVILDFYKTQPENLLRKSNL